MIFYDLRIGYKCEAEKDAEKKHARGREHEHDHMERDIRSVNEAINGRRSEKCDFYAYAYDATESAVSFAYGYEPKKMARDGAIKKITDALSREFKKAEYSVASFDEITAERFSDLLALMEERDMAPFRSHRVSRMLDMDYFDASSFSVSEETMDEAPLSREEAIVEARRLMCDDSMTEEHERIYSDENVHEFFGHPVHYRIVCGHRETGLLMAKLIIRALYTNGRLIGTRLSRIYDIEEGFYDEDTETVFEKSSGASLMIELQGTPGEHGNFASSYEGIINLFSNLIKKTSDYTLFFLVENTEQPGFGPAFCEKINDTVNFIELREGGGSRDEATAYLKKLIGKSKMASLGDEGAEKYLPQGRKTYRPYEVYEAYEAWERDALRERAYKAYRKIELVKPKKKDERSKPYERLQKMVGLTEVKSIIDSIVATSKVDKLREKLGVDCEPKSLHMVFTGNPGSAKTTVARLLGKILRDEGVLESGRFVECGRQDLIAKYVGWTAKAVERKFREAMGGVLFIDEAYSLVDDSHSFGDEAINTIVQQMENMRGKVAVIFAGYPGKMKEFLSKNEGLRSRIAFHVNFPDYTADEMTEILKLLANEREYEMDDEAAQKCHEIFAQAVHQKDFGNGRFARNLLERAVMRQSKRISEMNNAKSLARADLMRLTADDFEITAPMKTVKKNKIGFAVE